MVWSGGAMALSAKEEQVIRTHFRVAGRRQGVRVLQWTGFYSTFNPATGRLWVHNDTPRKQTLQELVFVSCDSEAPTLTCSHPLKLWDILRRLTARETARLMGFPERMRLPDARYHRLFSNAVVVDCARWAISRVCSRGESLRHLDLCAGVGGFAFAARAVSAHVRCVGYSEIYPAAIACYAANWPHAPALGDATAVERWPRADLLTAGFPCTAFSKSNSRARRLIHRDRDFVEVVLHAIRCSSVSRVVLENVPQFETQSGDRYERLLDTLDDWGFRVDVAVLDARDFGVPQQRKRLFIVGRRGGGAPLPLARAEGPRTARIRDVLS